MTNKTQIVLDTFQYQAKWTMQQLRETHVPSVFFMTNIELETAVYRCITEGKLEVDANGVYSIPE